MHLDAAVAHRVQHSEVTETHPSERLDVRFDFQIDLVTRIEQTQIDVRSLQHQPEKPIGVSAESK